MYIEVMISKEKQINKENEMTNEKKKGFREVVKQIADRQRSYSLAYYVRMVKRYNGRDVRKHHIVSCIKNISRQYDYRGVKVINDRVYNYTLAAVAA